MSAPQESVVCIGLFLLRLRGATGQRPGEPQDRCHHEDGVVKISADTNNKTFFF